MIIWPILASSALSTLGGGALPSPVNAMPSDRRTAANTVLVMGGEFDIGGNLRERRGGTPLNLCAPPPRQLDAGETLGWLLRRSRSYRRRHHCSAPIFLSAVPPDLPSAPAASRIPAPNALSPPE